jgi:hypothetical protein
VTERWVADPAADVVWAGDHDGHRGVRVRLSSGDLSTVWFPVGDLTRRVEACILPAPPAGRREEVYRQSLARNPAGRRLHLALDRHGEVVLVGRLPLAEMESDEPELLLGEAHEGLEVTRPTLARAAYEREKNT